MSCNMLIVKEIRDPDDPKKTLKLQFSQKELDLCKADEKFLRCMVLMHKKAYNMPYRKEKFLRQVLDEVGQEKLLELDFELYYASFMENILDIPSFDMPPQVQYNVNPQTLHHDYTENVLKKTDEILEEMAFDELDPSEVTMNQQFLGNCNRDKLGLIDYSGSDEEQDRMCSEQEYEDFFSQLEDESASGEKIATKKVGKKGVPKVSSEWTVEKDKYLLAKYEEYQYLLEKNARKFWQTLMKLVNSDIRAKGETLYSSQDVKGRIANLQKIYKNCVNKNDGTGQPPTTCDNYEIMNRVFHDQAWLKPVSLAGRGLDYESPTSPKKKCKTEDTLQTLLTYRQARDAAKDEANAKKATKLEEYRTQKLTLLSKLVNKN